MRVHNAIGYVTQKDNLEGQEFVIFAKRKRKLATARKKRSLAHSQTEPGAPPQSSQRSTRV
jgi:hypothetical protein